jgi:hypothetical protein
MRVLMVVTCECWREGQARPCLPKGPTNSARIRAIVTAALQRQYTYLQTKLILWIRLVKVLLGEQAKQQELFAACYLNVCKNLKKFM